MTTTIERHASFSTTTVVHEVSIPIIGCDSLVKVNFDTGESEGSCRLSESQSVTASESTRHISITSSHSLVDDEFEDLLADLD